MTYIFSRFSEEFCCQLRLVQLLNASAFYVVFSPASTSALADRRAPHQQSHLILLAVSALSLDQRLISEPLTSNAIHKAIQPYQGVVLDVAFVKPEGKFINIAVKMLLAGVVIHADQPALENSENALDAIGGHVVADIFPLTVIDRIVIEGHASNADISARFVGMDSRTSLDILEDRGLDCLRVRSGDWHGDCPSAALAHPENGRFADCAASRLEFFAFVLVGFLTADKSFVNLDNTGEFLEIGAAASFPQPMQDEPSGLLRDPDFLGKLHRGYALARCHEQVHCVNPLVQRNVAALKYRPGAHGKVFLALVAAIEAASPFSDSLAKAANRAARAIGPQPAFKVGPGRLLIREHLEKLEGRNGALAHGPTLKFWLNPSLENRGSQVYNSLKETFPAFGLKF
jgi:hypothetical protein